MENKKLIKNNSYYEGTYKYGTLATLIAMAIMLGIPVIISVVFDVWPDSIGQLLLAAGPLLAMFIPSAISENVSMIPVQGTSVYLNSILGNVMNIKFPCYLNTIEKVNANPGTELADAIGMCAVTISGMVTMVVIAVGLLLLVPLEPVLTSPTVTTATSYIMPALYGSMEIAAFTSKSAGEYRATGKPIIAAINVALVLLFNYFIIPVKGKEGYAMLIMLLVTVFLAKILYDKGIVKIVEK